MPEDARDKKIVIVEIAQALVSIFIAFHVGNFLQKELTLSIGRLLPLDLRDVLLRIPSSAIGAGVGWQLWQRRFLLPLILSGTYLYSDYLETFETVIIDWSPFQSLGRDAGLNLWAVLLIVATLSGTISGQWIGTHLRNRFLRTPRSLLPSRFFLGGWWH
jgi:hypothetical protein